MLNLLAAVTILLSVTSSAGNTPQSEQAPDAYFAYVSASGIVHRKINREAATDVKGRRVSQKSSNSYRNSYSYFYDAIALTDWASYQYAYGYWYPTLPTIPTSSTTSVPSMTPTPSMTLAPTKASSEEPSKEPSSPEAPSQPKSSEGVAVMSTDGRSHVSSEGSQEKPALPPPPCGAKIVDPKDVAKHMTIGTDKNMIMPPTVDWTGIWWMKDNPFHEVLDSSAGIVGEFQEPYFPMTARVQSARKGVWAWPDTVDGRSLMQNLVAGDPFEHRPGKFVNDSFVDISPDFGFGLVEWHMVKKNADEWLRPIQYKWPLSMFFTNFTYTRTRIIYTDGTPHPKHFEEFLNYMGNKKLLIWDTNDQCTRKCGIMGECCQNAFACKGKAMASKVHSARIHKIPKSKDELIDMAKNGIQAGFTDDF